MSMTIEDAIAMYRAAEESADSEYDDKTYAIELLEAHVPEPSVLTFFLEILQDPSEYDLARVEVLKIVAVAGRTELAGAWRDRFGEAVAAILRNRDDDNLVRQYAGLAMLGVLDVDDVVAAGENVLLDHGDDEALRHNVLGSFERWGPTDTSRSILERASADETIGQFARTVLTKRWPPPDGA